MVRIIPWSLPPVKGGSIGGYTPKVDPEPPTPEPEPPAQYFDFSSVSITGNDYHGGSVHSTGSSIPAGTTATQTGDSGYLKLSGIQVVDLIGVSSLSVKVAFSSKNQYNAAEWSSDDAIFSLDPLTYVATFVSGTVTGDNSGGGSSASWIADATFAPDATSWTVHSLTLTFYVYNGNGEIIQTEEVELVGGE